MTSLHRQPDDPGSHQDSDIFGPIVYGRASAELTPNTIKTIRKNAGKVAPFKIAEALRWSFTRLRRVAQANGIDLRYPPAKEDSEPRGA